MKYILIFNGCPRSGKTTFERALAEKYNSLIYSSITPIIELTEQMIKATGNEYLNDFYDFTACTKNFRYRKLLSDMKNALYSFDDGVYINSKLYEQVLKFIRDDSIEFLMIDIREPKMIQSFIRMLKIKFIFTYNFKVRTILIKNTHNELFGNISDDNVEDYQYDLVIHNNSTLEKFTGEILEGFIQILKNDYESQATGVYSIRDR